MTLTIPGQIIKMDVETGIDPVWYGKLQNLFDEVNTLAGVVSPVGATPITASLGANVALNNTGLYFTGPSVAQGSSGTWFVSGTVTLGDSVGAAVIQCKLWDGTTVIASTTVTLSATSSGSPATLSGFLASPAGNLRISCRGSSSVNSLIIANGSGNARDSVISAFRIA